MKLWLTRLVHPPSELKSQKLMNEFKTNYRFARTSLGSIGGISENNLLGKTATERKTQNQFLNLTLSIKNRLETQMARFQKSREFFFSTPGFIWLQDLQDTEVQRRF